MSTLSRPIAGCAVGARQGMQQGRCSEVLVKAGQPGLL